MKFKVTFWDPNDRGSFNIQEDLDDQGMIELPDTTYNFFEVLHQYTDTMLRWGRFAINFNASPPEICFMNRHD